jgi:CBS domain-containing protein
LVKQFGRELEHAFGFVMLMDIHHQFEQIQGGEKADHLFYPDRLSNLERKTLREAFHLIDRLQELIVEWYEPQIGIH